MKVAVRFSLEVDAEAWAYEFGIEADQVREDIRAYFETICRAQLRDVLGLEQERS